MSWNGIKYRPEMHKKCQKNIEIGSKIYNGYCKMHVAQHPEYKSDRDYEKQQYKIKKQDDAAKNKLLSMAPAPASAPATSATPATIRNKHTNHIHDVINKLDAAPEKKADFIKFYDIFAIACYKYIRCSGNKYTRVSSPRSAMCGAIDIAKLFGFDHAYIYMQTVHSQLFTKKLLSDKKLFSEPDCEFLVGFWEKYLQ